MLSRDFDVECDWFTENPNQHPWLRPYQIDANAAIEEAIAERKRQMLVAMATGTGKTFTLVNEIYRLMKSGVGKRILFLVDRRALAAQAVRAFASFEPEPNQKFDKIYEVYSQRFQREDLEEGDASLTRKCCRSRTSNIRSRSTPSSTSARSSGWRSTCSDAKRSGAAKRTSRTTPSSSRYPHPRLRRRHRRRMPSRVHDRRRVRLAQHARPLRRHQDRPDRDAGRPHEGVFQRRGLPLRIRARGARRATSSTTTS